jgi:HSP20 family molecular chaperone IbpA
MSQPDERTRMWAAACEMLERAERLQRQFFQPALAGGQRVAWEPPVDVFEADGALWIVVALPGVEPQDAELLIDGADLLIAGVRRLPGRLRGAAILRMEVPAGRFQRRISLPPGRYELGLRSFAHGCLTLELRRF